MKRVVSAEEMKWCDETAIGTYRIPGLLLMENAGRGVVEVMKKEFSSLESKHIVIICGKGNNGGDGFVAARMLFNSGAQISVLLAASPSELKNDAKTNFKMLQVIAKKSMGKITVRRYSKRILPKLPQPDIILDAMFGTGFTGSVRKPFSDLIAWVNQQPAKIVSVDIPSGINGTTGVVKNCAIRAHLTVTCGCLKSGLLCNQGRELVGSVRVVDIGIPRTVLEDLRLQTFLVERSDVQRILPKRSIHAHKYSVGKVLVLAGSKGFTGAAALCCTSTLRAGAGAVVLGTPELVYPILARKLTESMVFPLPGTSAGTLGLAALDSILERLAWADVLVIGPGLSLNSETQNLILKILHEYRGKALIDADGLNALAVHGVSKMNSIRAQVILTPHVGEFSRLSRISSNDVEERRIDAAREFAKRVGVTAVLKGVPTITASKNGSAFLNSTGNPGMATAGAGDVLSGIIAGLWAQGMSDIEAAWAGVFLHGLSGDTIAKKIGERSLVANDIIEYLPSVLQSVEGGSTFMRDFSRYQLPLFIWAAIIFWLSSLTSLPHIKIPIIGADKFAHMSVFFVFCWFSHRALFFQTASPILKRWSVVCAFLLTCIYGYFDEVHQLYVPGRTYDMFDLIADAIGAFLFVLLFTILGRRKDKQSSTS